MLNGSSILYCALRPICSGIDCRPRNIRSVGYNLLAPDSPQAGRHGPNRPDHGSRKWLEVETTPLHRGGWPLGAWVELDRLNGTHSASAASPYDAGWAGEKIRLGGSWLSPAPCGLPLSLTGHQAGRLVVNENVLTVLTSGLQIRFNNPENLVFSAPRLQLAFSGRWPDRQFSAQTLSGRLIRFPAGRPDATRLGLIAHAATVNGFPCPTASPATCATHVWQSLSQHRSQRRDFRCSTPRPTDASSFRMPPPLLSRLLRTTGSP